MFGKIENGPGSVIGVQVSETTGVGVGWGPMNRLEGRDEHSERMGPQGIEEGPLDPLSRLPSLLLRLLPLLPLLPSPVFCLCPSLSPWSLSSLFISVSVSLRLCLFPHLSLLLSSSPFVPLSYISVPLDLSLRLSFSVALRLFPSVPLPSLCLWWSLLVLRLCL